ncbi:MAG TPA: hypothetical protein VHB68_04020 [Steroidobacteraceae bacterium]|nr:hypothetical protein [Steroidobacteraceae bacterium]
MPQNQQPATPALPQYPPPRPQYVPPQWSHSETTYREDNGFHYHPFVFHIDGGGTITQRASENNYDNGWNAGAGFTWYPTSLWQIGIRVDGTYSQFDARSPLLQQASTTYGTPVTSGTTKMWGGDTDLEIDLPLSHYVRFYLLAGGGWYRQQTTFRQTQLVNGYICYWFGCGPGYFGVTQDVARYNTDWHFAKNAGFGMDFALGPRTSFFVEARYMRLNPAGAHMDFLPIRAGFRF